MEKITAHLRVTSQKVIPFEYDSHTIMGEAIELRVAGVWNDDTGQKYPASLHITLYPGHPIRPFLGDELTITVEQSK